MMLPSRGVQVYAAATPTDMRKSFNTLAHLVKSEMGRDPLSGELFLFTNARRTRAKVLFWDGTGLVIYMKRLERLKFAAPWERASEGAVVMSPAELQLFLEGSPLVFVGKLSPEYVQPGRVVSRPLIVSSPDPRQR
jgi:transposase